MDGGRRDFALLDALPDELLHEVWRHALVAHLPSALRLRQTSRALFNRLLPVRAESEARRLQWLPTATSRCEISDQGRVATKYVGDGRLPWAASGLLPTEGRSAWSVRIDASVKNAGYVDVGVCDTACRNGWGLYLVTGLLGRIALNEQEHSLRGVPPPKGWPDGHRKRLMWDDSGQPTNLRGRAEGAVIEVIVDHDTGTLSFRINGGPPILALSGFPRGAALRAWVSLFAEEPDRVSLVRPYL
jgi:hypothetical protein